MKNNGFTLIELIIVLAIIAIIAAIALPVILGTSSDKPRGQWSVNGYTDTICVEGYRFVVGPDGQSRQIMDEYGHGVRCETR